MANPCPYCVVSVEGLDGKCIGTCVTCCECKRDISAFLNPEALRVAKRDAKPEPEASFARYRDGTAARLRTHLESARALLDSVEYGLEAGGDVAQSAAALSSATDRVLETAAVLRALDHLAKEKPT